MENLAIRSYVQSVESQWSEGRIDDLRDDFAQSLSCLLYCPCDFYISKLLVRFRDCTSFCPGHNSGIWEFSRFGLFCPAYVYCAFAWLGTSASKICLCLYIFDPSFNGGEAWLKIYRTRDAYLRPMHPILLQLRRSKIIIEATHFQLLLDVSCRRLWVSFVTDDDWEGQEMSRPVERDLQVVQSLWVLKPSSGNSWSVKPIIWWAAVGQRAVSVREGQAK
jgi:hypothetical protein